MVYVDRTFAGDPQSVSRVDEDPPINSPLMYLSPQKRPLAATYSMLDTTALPESHDYSR